MPNPCPQYISSYIRDLTSSYTDKSNDSAMVSASVTMFALTGLFFNLSLFSGVSDVSTIVAPRVRLFLTSAFSLFLPVMSYLFSEAKNAGGYTNTTSPTTPTRVTDLSLRAGLILAWMLLVELIRKKVDVIHVYSYSGIIQRAARVIWLGNLVFFNIRAVGPKAAFSVLWILCATKLLQRIAFTEVGKRSYAHGKNSRLISSYMARILGHDDDNHLERGGGGGLSAAHEDLEQAVQQEGWRGDDEQLLKRCMYIVMGEEELVEEPTADGYKLKASSEGSGIVTVGKVWEFAEKDELFVASSDKLKQQLKRICLSFALFKLLRRRIEHPRGMTDKEARSCRDLLLRGLYNSNNGGGSTTVFQVINDEVTFLSEYYHSVVPVVLASPFFFFVNYFLLHIVVIMLCLMIIVICGHGDVSSAIDSIGNSYVLRFEVASVVVCLVSRASASTASSTAAFFSIVDLSITVLLFLIFFYEEIWEFLVFLLSSWFMVSLLCNHIAKPHSRSSRRTFRCAVHTIMWLRSKMSHTTLRFKQFSVLNLRWPLEYLPLLAIPYAVVETKLVPKALKESILEYLLEHDRGTAGYTPLTRGKSALQRNSNDLSNRLSWACKMDSVAEVILTWHIATGILEAKSGKEEAAALSRVAIRLSKYCAYLVAFHPELLPDDNQEKAELVLEDMHKELKSMLGCRAYYLSSQRARIDKILETTTGQTTSDDRNKVVVNGAKLGRSLMAEASNDPQAVWKVLADVWTELVIYLAPSSDDDRFKGHEDLLAQGGEFITLIWALTTHIGMSRPPPSKETTGDRTEEALKE